MHLYLVRHGQTTNNLAQTHQGPDSQLTDLGKQQASYVAEKLKQFPIDIILTSPFDRARATTAIINAVVNKDVVVTELLREVMKPKELHGMHFDEREAQRVSQLIRENAHDTAWHYSDEENFHDYSKRAKDFLALLDQYKNKNVLAVTHGGFLWVLMATLLFNNKLTPDLDEDVKQFFYSTNTGISMVEKDPRWGWQLKTWNDYAHLKELE